MVEDPSDRRGSFLKRTKRLNSVGNCCASFLFVGILMDVDFSNLCGSYIFSGYSLRQRIVKFGNQLTDQNRDIRVVLKGSPSLWLLYLTLVSENFCE